MMNYGQFGFAFSGSPVWFWPLHGLFCLTLLVGVVLFFIWAAKSLDKKVLKSLMIWTLVVGAVGVLLSGVFMMSNDGKYFSSRNFYNWQDMAERMRSLSDEEYSKLDTTEKWQEYMFGEDKAQK